MGKSRKVKDTKKVVHFCLFFNIGLRLHHEAHGEAKKKQPSELGKGDLKRHQIVLSLAAKREKGYAAVL